MHDVSGTSDDTVGLGDATTLAHAPVASVGYEDDLVLEAGHLQWIPLTERLHGLCRYTHKNKTKEIQRSELLRPML